MDRKNGDFSFHSMGSGFWTMSWAPTMLSAVTKAIGEEDEAIEGGGAAQVGSERGSSVRRRGELPEIPRTTNRQK
ncbi:hypothetical protein Dimus_027132 [Dionaea muscipula]